MQKSNRRSSIIFAALLAIVFMAACSQPFARLEPGAHQGSLARALVPPQGGATTFDVASWNLEWFGDTANAPTNDALQLQNVTTVISGADMDIWGLVEVVGTAQFNSLKSQLPGYTGFLANDPLVTDGAAYYSDFGNLEQKVGILYKSSLATLVGAKIILTANDYDFGGRPPMQVALNVTLNGTSETVYVIVLHAKAISDTASWQRRLNGSNALKSYLDANLPTQKVWVVGDWNDDVDTSITAGKASPYANFVNDGLRYKFPTKALSDAGIATTVNYPDAIDHHLDSDEVYSTYIANSATAFRPDSYIASYGTTTSDHYPVFTRYTWASGTPTPAIKVTSPNGGESWASSSVHPLTWTSSNVGTVKIEYSLDGGGAWNLLTSSTSASSGSFSWTLPSAASSSVLVRVGDTASATTDSSDGVFSIVASLPPGQVIINEICANEPGSNTAGEFIELVNVGGTAVDLGAWTLRDSSAIRHTFATGTLLQPGKAVVVFGGASAIPGGLANALAASTGTLNLANGGDTVSIRNAAATTIQIFTYGSSLANEDGVSMNRSPDGSATGAFVKHNTISSLPRSAGTKATGSAW